MNPNLLQRQLKASKNENIEFLGNQPTGSPEFIMAKIALDHKLQTELLRPTWILAIATIATLGVTLFQMYNLEQRLNQIESKIINDVSSSGSVIRK